MRERLRRHARLIAGALVLLLIAGLGYVLRGAGASHVQPARAAAAAPLATPTAPSPVVAGRAVSATVPAKPPKQHLAAARSIRAQPPVARRGAAPHGVPSPAPTSRTVGLALRQATGLDPAQVSSRPVCGRPAPGHASCAAQLLVLRSSGAPVRPHVVRARTPRRVKPALAGTPQSTSVPSSPAPQPDTPAYLEQAYDLSYLSQSAGAGDTVAVVDAYDDPSAQSDLAFYRSYYGLPPCGTGCFQKVNQTGGTGPLPPADAGWDQEISLDLDAVSAICPNCHILLVEANSALLSDLQPAMQTAVTLGAKQISASWAASSSGVPAGRYAFSGVATVAAAGDYGYAGSGQDNYPAAIPGVTAAGGTTLASASTPGARGFSEGAWSWNGANGSGSGCDSHFARPSYQPALGCAGRAYADVSADADPTTGLAVYENGSWSLVGGTSLSTPIIAAYYAVSGVSATTPRWAYSDSGLLNDVVSGWNGNCAGAIAYICQAGVGYDGPTGVGSISGSVVPGAPGIGGPAVSSAAGATYTRTASAHGATIAGGIYRNGLDTSWWIEYGTSTAYGSQTAPSDLGSGSAPVAVTGYLSQLSPGTTYHYRLVAQNSLGTTYGYDYTFTTAVASSPSPTAALAAPAGAAAPGTAVTFDASASAPAPGASISDYRWSFGDGSSADTSTSATATHTYSARGTYTVTVTVTSNGQTDTSTQTVTVDTPPTAAFSPSASAVAPGTALSFYAAASAAAAGGSIADYSWSFGDGSSADTGATANASHTYSAPGPYTVTLTTTDDLDVTATVTKVITVAAFTASPANPAPGAAVTFTALNPSAAATDYLWNFGDGSSTDTGTTPSVTHTFSARGSYSVTLTVQTSTGGVANASPITTSAASVTVDAPPTAAFSSSRSVVGPGAPVNFNASTSTAAAGGSIADYSWDFGDGSAPQDVHGSSGATHSYGSPGVYTVTLTTTDDLGGVGTQSHQVTVDQPVAAFTAPASLAPGAGAVFDASGSSDAVSTIVDYSWNFGDGSAAVDAGTTATATHTFATAGTYTVKLTTTSALGLTASAVRQVVVAAAANGSAGPAPVSTPAPVAAPAPAPTPAPVSAPPPAPGAPPAFVAKLTMPGPRRLAPALARGLRLGVAVNQSIRGTFQISVPPAETRQGARLSSGGRPVVLLRRTQALGAGGHTITLKVSRSAVARLRAGSRLVLTVRVTLVGAGGATVTRTLKVTLAR